MENSMESSELESVVDVTDEIVRASRYGKRNYRKSIGADFRRHWHGTFVKEERFEVQEGSEELQKIVDVQEPEADIEEELVANNAENIAPFQAASEDPFGGSDVDAEEASQFFDPMRAAETAENVEVPVDLAADDEPTVDDQEDDEDAN